MTVNLSLEVTFASAVDINGSNLKTYKTYGKYYLPMSFIANDKNKEKRFYYKWFTYNDLKISGTSCYSDKSCGSFVNSKSIKPILTFSKKYPLRAGFVKIYSNLSDCNLDKNGKSKKGCSSC